MDKKIKFTCLGSGSKGNCTALRTEDGVVLIDAGFSAKELEKRLRESDIAPEEVRAILITHEHGDHVKGCKVFSTRYHIPVFATAVTCKVMADSGTIGEDRVLISAGSPFSVCGLTAEAFSIPHDARDTVAYLFRSGEIRIAVATDLGCLNLLAMTKLKECSLLFLESNHDRRMLADSNRPIHLKRRILGRHGHLSNDDCLAALETLLCPKTHALVLGHLSGECNDRDLLQTLALEKLAFLNRRDILLQIAEQDRPMPTVCVY